MSNLNFRQRLNTFRFDALAFAVVAAILGTIFPLAALAQEADSDFDQNAIVANSTNSVSFSLVTNPKFADCLRASPQSVPRARATVVRGKLNDTLVLDLIGFKPGLAFDLFTVQRSPFIGDNIPDPTFKGSFGLAWYQSDIEIAKGNIGSVRVETILLDQIFGFDPDVALSPTNTFHLGFWFNNPQDAAACGFPANDPTKFTPFNGEHNAGPLAMISVPNPSTKLGPLCTELDPAHPGKCKL